MQGLLDRWEAICGAHSVRVDEVASQAAKRSLASGLTWMSVARENDGSMFVDLHSSAHAACMELANDLGVARRPLIPVALYNLDDDRRWSVAYDLAVSSNVEVVDDDLHACGTTRGYGHGDEPEGEDDPRLEEAS